MDKLQITLALKHTNGALYSRQISISSDIFQWHSFSTFTLMLDLWPKSRLPGVVMACTHTCSLRTCQLPSNIQLASNGVYVALPAGRSEVAVWSLQDITCKVRNLSQDVVLFFF